MCLHVVKWVVKEFQYSQGRFIIPRRSENYKMGPNLGQNLCGLFWFLFPIQQTDIMVHMRRWLPHVTLPLYCYHSHVIQGEMAQQCKIEQDRYVLDAINGAKDMLILTGKRDKTS